LKKNGIRLKNGFTMVEMVVVVALLAIVALLVVQSVGHVRAEAEETVVRSNLQAIRDAFCGTVGAPGFLADMQCVPGFSNRCMRIGNLLEAPTNLPAGTNYDRLARRGWRGPYVQNARLVDNTNEALRGLFPAPDDRRWETDATFAERRFYPAAGDYGTTNDPALADPWGNPFVLQMPTNDWDDAELLRYARVVSAGPDGELDTPCDKLAGMGMGGIVANRGDDWVLFLKRTDVYEAE